MFSEQPKASQANTYTPSDNDFATAEQMIATNPLLKSDSHALNMVENGFVSPDGTQLNPVEFAQQRLAILESGDNDISAEDMKEDPMIMIQHSPAPTTEHGSLSQQ